MTSALEHSEREIRAELARFGTDSLLEMQVIAARRLTHPEDPLTFLADVELDGWIGDELAMRGAR